MCIRKTISVLFILFLFPTLSYSQENIENALQISNQLSDILSELALQVEQFDSIEKELDRLVNLEKDSDQKNRILISIISTSAISSICEYEVDLGNIFIEMKNKNRRFYDDARIESIKNAIEQIRSIQELIQINNSLLVVDKSYSKLMRKQKQAIENVILVLSNSIDILKKP